MLICNVVGARPNFMKMAPVVLELKRRGAEQILVHTGQHYDAEMSAVFFRELGMPQPDIDLGVGSGSHARQTADVMTSFDEVVEQHRPGLVVVAGDVNSTMAASLVAAKRQVPIAHVEAGLRSFDRTMPEEINRVVTDQVSRLLFTTEESANINLEREGIPASRIYFVGNCMVDTLMKHRDAAISLEPWRLFGVERANYALLTLHRPSNVDEDNNLSALLTIIRKIATRLPVIFPMHPRTRDRLRCADGRARSELQLTGPLPYLTFLGLMAAAKFVLTDSGGVQEETTALGVPCLTLRSNTERPVTETWGTNRVVGTSEERICECVDRILARDWQAGKLPPLWDGRASLRIADALQDFDSAAFPKGGSVVS